MKILVATNNQSKIAAVEQAFKDMFPRVKSFEISSKDSSSGVARQPMSSEETKKGAHNRAYGLYKENEGFDYYVGVESGLKLSKNNEGYFVTKDWACIINKEGLENYGSNGGAYLPKPVCDLISQGLSVKQAMQKTFADYGSEHKGALAYLTNKHINRETEIYNAVAQGLIPFTMPENYQELLSRPKSRR